MVERNVVVLLTSSPRKHEEWCCTLKRYGLKVEMHANWANAKEILALLDRGDVKFVCDEESDLFTRDATERCSWRHLEPVSHISRITCYRLRDGQLRAAIYTGKREGYLDLISGGKTPDGWWDTAFRLCESHQTYHEQNPKRSARDDALSKLMRAELHYANLLRRNSDVQHLGRPVDFTTPVSTRIMRDPLYTSAQAEAMGLTSLLLAAISRGLFDRFARSRTQQNCWEPNFAGIPAVRKPEEIHESTYAFHDLTHMLVGDPVLVNERDPLSWQIYFLSRMSSEAFSLFLADGLFVESVRRSGIEYDFSQRRAHPLLMGDLGLLERTPSVPELLALIKANARFFVIGDNSALEKMVADSGLPQTNLRRYLDWYSVFSVKDAYWTECNYIQLAKQAEPRGRWWAATRKLRGLAPELNLFSVSDIIARLKEMGQPNLQVAGTRDDLIALLDLIVEESFQRNIARFYSPPGVSAVPNLAVSEEVERSRAFLRWIIGQLYLFEVFRDAPSAEYCRDTIIESVLNAWDNGGIGLDLIANIRSYFEEFLASLHRAGRLSREEKVMWADTFPHFPASYLSYRETHETPREVSMKLLMTPFRRSELAGAVVLISDRRRFILQRKDSSHPNDRCRGTLSLFGGSCDNSAHVHADELSWVGLKRELDEEIDNPGLAREIYHSSILWRRYVLIGNQFPGNYPVAVYLAEVSTSTLDRWYLELAKPGVVCEGHVQLVASIAELESLMTNTDNFIASHDVPLGEYLESIA